MNEYRQEPEVTSHREPNPTSFLTAHFGVLNGGDATFSPCQTQEGRHWQVEVLERGIATSATGSRWAEVYGGDCDGSRVAPAPVLHGACNPNGFAPDLVTRTARASTLKQRRAQRRCHEAIPQRVSVLVPASTSFRSTAIGRAIVSYVSISLSIRGPEHLRQSHMRYKKHNREQNHTGCRAHRRDGVSQITNCLRNANVYSYCRVTLHSMYVCRIIQYSMHTHKLAE